MQHDQYEGCKNSGSNLKVKKKKKQEIVEIRDDNCKIFILGTEKAVTYKHSPGNYVKLKGDWFLIFQALFFL